MEHKCDGLETGIKSPLIANVTSLEEMIEQSIGRINFTQVLQAILASIPVLFGSQLTFISVFVHAKPTWHCTSDSTLCRPNSNICNLSKSDWAWDSGNVYTSIVSEWDLECASSLITGLPATSNFAGCFLGGLLMASFGDSSLGRKNLSLVSALIMCISALASAFSPNIWIYSVLQFLSGVGRAPIWICVLVLLTERVGRRWRGQVAMTCFIVFSLGLLTLTGIAYLARGSSWRALYIWISVPGIICYVVAYFFTLESPRWLFMQGRATEAVVVLEKLGSTNQTFCILPSMLTIQSRVPKTINPFASLRILFNSKWAVRRLLASVVLSFGIGLMYFGMFLGVGNLGYNIYLTSVFNASSSTLSYLLTFLFWIQKCNRRSSLLGFCMISGVTSIIFSTIGMGKVPIALELVPFFCACMAYNVVLMYVVELFPTCIRNSASSLVRQAMILGSVFDPLLNQLGSTNLFYSYGVFGLATIVGGFMVLCLPETKGKALCDTMEEQEISDRSYQSIVS